MFIQSVRAMARAERLRPQTDRIQAILDKYQELIWRQPTVYMSSVDVIRTENGELTDKQVIAIFVTEYIHQGTLPPEDRISECIEGVEVHFLVPQ